MMWTWFTYGLLGCAALAFYLKLFEKKPFMLRFAIFLIGDAALAAYTYFDMAS